MTKDNIQEILVQKGRNLILEKGVDYLTARKLSEASGYSVGTIYNQFGNMDNFILIQNYLTLDELYTKLNAVDTNNPPAVLLNLYVKTFADFVLQNKNFWFLVHDFHLRHNNRRFSFIYLRRVNRIIRLLDNTTKRIVTRLETPERILSVQVLWLTLFALSAYLTTDSLQNFKKIDQTALCELLLNTYLSGLKVLENL
jgi:AcrR family transcriptional regulator